MSDRGLVSVSWSGVEGRGASQSSSLLIVESDSVALFESSGSNATHREPPSSHSHTSFCNAKKSSTQGDSTSLREVTSEEHAGQESWRATLEKRTRSL